MTRITLAQDYFFHHLLQGNAVIGRVEREKVREFHNILCFLPFPSFSFTPSTQKSEPTKSGKSPRDFHVAFSTDPIVPPSSLFTSQWNTPLQHSQAPFSFTKQTAGLPTQEKPDVHVSVENVFFPCIYSNLFLNYIAFTMENVEIKEYQRSGCKNNEKNTFMCRYHGIKSEQVFSTRE